MPKKKQNKRKKITRARNKKDSIVTVFKINLFILAVALVSYAALGFFYDPSFFQRDLKSKFAWAVGTANLVSLSIVNNPPDVPVVSASTACSGQDPYVILSWGTDPKANNYDIYRNGEILFSDLADITYSDTNVVENTTYIYYVVAKGVVGNTPSDPVSIQTGSCYVPPIIPEPEPVPEPEAAPEPEEPTMQIYALDITDLRKFKCLAKTDRKTPSFSGISNLSKARIRLVLQRILKTKTKTVLTSSTVSNQNGYWYFHLPEKINKGRYILYATAVDSDDSSRSVSDSLRFNAVKRSEKKKRLLACWGDSNKNSKKKKKTASKSSSTTIIALQVNNDGNSLTSGEELDVTINNDGLQYDDSVEFRVVDSEDAIAYQTEAVATETSPDFSVYRISLPASLADGNYRIIAKTIYGDLLLSAENYFRYKEAPLINFGGNIYLTLGALLSSLSTAIIILLGTMVFFASLLFLEYLLAGKRLWRVDENSLKNKGLIS